MLLSKKIQTVTYDFQPSKQSHEKLMQIHTATITGKTNYKRDQEYNYTSLSDILLKIKSRE